MGSGQLGGTRHTLRPLLHLVNKKCQSRSHFESVFTQRKSHPPPSVGIFLSRWLTAEGDASKPLRPAPTVPKPEEARCPGNRQEEPTPKIAGQGEQRRGTVRRWGKTVSAARAESRGLPPVFGWSASGKMLTSPLLPDCTPLVRRD